MSENPSAMAPTPKPPASHTWALVLFIAMAGMNIMLNMGGHFDVLGMMATVTALAGIIGFVFWRRSSRTYTAGVVALGFAVLRGGQSAIVCLHAQISGVGIGWVRVVGVCWMVFLLVLLFRAYTLGAASRRYYSLPERPNSRRT